MFGLKADNGRIEYLILLNLDFLVYKKDKGTADRVKINYNIFHKNSNYLTFVKVPLYCWTYLLKK